MSGIEPSRVLVIDDDDMVLIIVRKLLEAEMFAVDVSLSAREALARLPQTRYDAILCDMWMPGMTGKDFYNQLRKDFPEYQSRIIFLTGDIASEATWDFIEQRRLPYVLKPVSPPELRRKLEEVIGERPGAAREARKGADNRRHRRVAVRGNVGVRKKKWAVGGPDITVIGNASKDGIYFLTERQYRPGTEVMVTFPYTGANDVEQEGYVVRVDERSEGRWGVAVALGAAVEAARAAMLGSEEDRQRQRVLTLADMTSEAPRAGGAVEQVSDAADLRLQLASEKQEARRLAQELTNAKTVYQRAAGERDRLAAEETERQQQVRELVASREAMAEQIEKLNHLLETLHEKLAAAEGERDQAEQELRAARQQAQMQEQELREAREQAQTQPAGESLQQQAAAADAPQTQELEAVVARLREEVKDLQARVQEFQVSGVGPLTILAAYCDMLKMNKSLDENTKKTLIEVTQQAYLLRTAFQKLTKKS